MLSSCGLDMLLSSEVYVVRRQLKKLSLLRLMLSVGKLTEDSTGNKGSSRETCVTEPITFECNKSGL